jgi:hypothetical protein
VETWVLDEEVEMITDNGTHDPPTWCELDVPGWAVICSDEGVLFSGLSYRLAKEAVSGMEGGRHCGLTIVTVDVAARLEKHEALV